MRAPTDTVVPPRELTPDEQQVLAAFRRMTPWARTQLYKAAVDYAKAWPGAKPAPRLRLVSTTVGGGASKLLQK